MPRFRTKPLSRLGHIAHGQLTMISDGIWPPWATKHAGRGFSLGSPARALTSDPFRFGADSPVAALARTGSAAFHSPLTFWKKLLPLLLLVAALWSAAACGGGEPETPSALGSIRETSSGVSPSSATRAAAAPTVSSGSSPTGGTGIIGVDSHTRPGIDSKDESIDQPTYPNGFQHT